MKTSLVTLLLTLCIAVAYAGTMSQATMIEALKKELVSINAAASKESYHDKGLALTIENKTANPIKILIDPAMIFQPEDTTYQDLVLEGQEYLVLSANGKKTINLQSYCGKSYASAPYENIKYNFNKQGDSVMIKTLQQIRKMGINKDIGQKAIWVLTNDHSLSNIYDPTFDKESRSLITFMAKLLGKEKPGYFAFQPVYAIPGATAYKTKSLKIYADFKWQLPESLAMTLAVYNEQGQVIETAFENREMAKGYYELTASFESINVPAGNYYFRLKEGDNIIKETKVVIE